MMIRFLAFIMVILLLDCYVLSAFRSYFASSVLSKGLVWFYYTSAIIGYLAIIFIAINFNNRLLHAPKYFNIWVGYAFAFIIFKLIFATVLSLEDLYRAVKFVYQAFNNFIIKNPSEPVTFESRRKFVGQIGLGIASLPFLSMLYGVTKGKYNYQVKKTTLFLRDLPSAFDGLKVVHISDIHAGSFDDLKEVQKGVEMIQDLNPDLILFTGDLVNQDADEILPYMDLFQSLQAPLGKFSCLGNHDYGTYKKWNSEADLKNNLLKLFRYQQEMGFTLLNNKTAVIQQNNQEICIVGVENWGKPPFPQKGDLNKAIQNINPNAFKILMSHDPTHWEAKVLPHAVEFQLTLSGHTHGMQFGVEIPGIKWSPSKYIYKQWAGLYQSKNQYLYVNRGFGFLGFPGRVGIWPEITEITLRSKS